jgi:hypothetical protein
MQDMVATMRLLASSLGDGPATRSLKRETLELARRLEDPAYAAECDRREEAADRRRAVTRERNAIAKDIENLKAVRAAACPRCFATHAGEC